MGLISYQKWHRQSVMTTQRQQMILWNAFYDKLTNATQTYNHVVVCDCRQTENVSGILVLQCHTPTAKVECTPHNQLNRQKVLGSTR